MYRKAAVAVGLSAVLAGGLATTAGGQGNSVTIRMDEFRFQGPAQLPEGRTRITLRNVGEFPHNLTVIDTYGRARRFASRTLEGGQRQRLTVRLRPGVYVAICTVFNGRHVANGMEKTFTVGEQDDDGNWS